MTPHYYYPAGATDHAPSGWLPVVRYLGKKPFDVERTIAGLRSPHGPKPPLWARELFEIAQAAYLVDTLAQRDETPDGWTRWLHLSVPVAEPDRWHPPRLERLLGVLTSDTWRIEFRQHPSEPEIPAPATPLFATRPSVPPTSVSLFSGGLDSLSYAASGTSPDGQPIALVSHSNHDGLPEIQQGLAKAVEDMGVDISLRPFAVRRIGRNSVTQRENELTTRSRAFLFLAAGAVVAASHDIGTLHVPENGHLALNPVLTRGRPGACTTRSTHPHTLRLFNDLLRSVGADLRAENPYLTFTKGEVCQQARAAGLVDSALALSVTCGAPGRIQHRNCGYCFPCLVRRAGLHHAMRRDGGDPTCYHGDPPWKSDKLVSGHAAEVDSLGDFAAMVQWLGTAFRMRDITAVASLPDDLDLKAAYEVVCRSREELVAMLEHEMCPRTKKALGWAPKV